MPPAMRVARQRKDAGRAADLASLADGFPECAALNIGGGKLLRAEIVIAAE